MEELPEITLRPIWEQTDEEVDNWFWSMPHHEWVKCEDRELVEHIKDRFAPRFMSEAGLPADRAPIIRRHLHIGEGRDGETRFICATFTLTGSTYFYSGDPADREGLNYWIEHDLIENQVGNYDSERLADLEDGWVDPGIV